MALRNLPPSMLLINQRLSPRFRWASEGYSVINADEEDQPKMSMSARKSLRSWWQRWL